VTSGLLVHPDTVRDATHRAATATITPQERAIVHRPLSRRSVCSLRTRSCTVKPTLRVHALCRRAPPS